MYGYEIVQTLIVDIEPDVHVKRAMNEINAGKSNDHLLSIHIHQIKVAAKHILDDLMRAQNYLLYI